MGVTYGDLTFERPGHATVRIESGDGTTLYIDPWTQALDGDEPHDADVVFVTHDDVDHYDPDAIEAVSNENTTVAAYEAIDTSDLDRSVEPLPYKGERTVGGIEVRTVPAYNRPDGDHVDEDGNPFHADGEVVGLLLSLNGTVVYYPSDTDFLDHHREVTADVFLPPIGGGYTMDRHDAAAFAESTGAELVLPLHYDTFEEIEADADAFKRAVESDDVTVALF